MEPNNYKVEPEGVYMNEKLQYRIDSELKNNYTEFIEEKYGSKLGTVGTKMEKTMKLHLALAGYEKYYDDLMLLFC